MSWQNAFRVIIRVIFIFAYIAFLAASIRHVATFFHNFESDQSDWVNPYTLAVSIDLTSLVLTVGVMFFRKNMPWYAQLFTWVFIVALTAFSWFVNWEYARTYQGTALKVDNTLLMLNPILASSFAFLNLAYSVVAEFFSSKTETAAELAAKMDELEQLEEQQQRLAAYKERTKQPSAIQRMKNTAIEARAAVSEVLAAGDVQNIDNIVDNIPDTVPTQSERITDKLHVPVEEETDEPTTDNIADNSTDNVADDVPTQASSKNEPRKPLYVSQDDAIALSGYSSEYLSRLVSQGKLKTKKNDSKLLLRSSLETYLSTHPRKAKDTVEESQVKEAVTV